MRIDHAVAVDLPVNAEAYGHVAAAADGCCLLRHSHAAHCLHVASFVFVPQEITTIVSHLLETLDWKVLQRQDWMVDYYYYYYCYYHWQDYETMWRQIQWSRMLEMG